MAAQRTVPAPLSAPIVRVSREWIDHNGHMNMAYYALVFDRAIDHFWREIGLGPEYTERTDGTTFALQSQIHYLKEVMLNDPLRVTFQLLDYDRKRIHCFMSMIHADKDYLAAIEERITIHVDSVARRSAPFPTEIFDSLKRLFYVHKSLPRDERIGSKPSLQK